MPNEPLKCCAPRAARGFSHIITETRVGSSIGKNWLHRYVYPRNSPPPGSPTLYLPASSLQLFELGQRNAKHFVAAVPPSAYLIGAHEIDHHLLMHERRFDLTRRHDADYGTNLNARRSLVTTENWFCYTPFTMIQGMLAAGTAP